MVGCCHINTVSLHKFAICLTSSTNTSGAIFFGDGPYAIVSSNLLTYTPLIRNPVAVGFVAAVDTSSSDYYIGLKSIRVGGKEIKLNKTLLSINEEGKGGTRLSTGKPYTVLHTSIYKALLKAFVKQINLIPEVEPPFGACFPSDSIGSDEFGPNVPWIDLVLQSEGNMYWRIMGANSMVKINHVLTCLAFVDGGSNPDTSIIIGGHQLEDNLLEFDLASSRLGFSSSLLTRHTTCSNLTSNPF